VRIEIVVHEVQPLSGRVTAEGEEPVGFSGWLGLLRILERLTDLAEVASDGLGGELPAGGHPELAEDV
jgi:hypothetical protein